MNNRNLKDFTVDTGNSTRLREQIPKDILFVSESGVKSAEDVAKLREIGADAVLIGETLMRAKEKKVMLAALREPEKKAMPAALREPDEKAMPAALREPDEKAMPTVLREPDEKAMSATLREEV